MAKPDGKYFPKERDGDNNNNDEEKNNPNSFHLLANPLLKCIWLSLSGYPQYSESFSFTFESLNSVPTEGQLTLLGISLDSTRKRILSEFAKWEEYFTALKKHLANPTQVPQPMKRFYFGFAEGFIWLDNFLSSNETQKRLIIADSPTELICRRIVKPTPAVILTEQIAKPLLMNGLSCKFRIELLDARGIPIKQPNVIVGIQEGFLQSTNDIFYVVVFDSIKITIPTFTFYQSYKPFYFRISAVGVEDLEYVSPPFYVMNHADLFRREPKILLKEIRPQRVPRNRQCQLTILGYFESHPTTSWSISLGSSKYYLSAKNIHNSSLNININADENWDGKVQITATDAQLSRSVFAESSVQIVDSNEVSNLPPLTISPSSTDSTMALDGFGYPDFIWAAGGGNDILLKECINRGEDVNIRDRDGRTALIWASRAKLVNIVKILLASGADVNIRDKLGYSALHFAAFSGSHTIVDLLLKAGAEINACTVYKDTPLHYAAAKTSALVVYKLVRAGADLTAANEEKETAIHWADKANSQVISDYIWSLTPLGQKLAPYISLKRLLEENPHLSQRYSITELLEKKSLSEINLDLNLMTISIISFDSVAPRSQMELLLHKLTQCLAPYEPSNTTAHNIIKKQLLVEIDSYIARLDTFTPFLFPDTLYLKMVQFMEVNALRPVPARHMLDGVIYHPDDDEQMDSIDIMHVELVYTIFNRLLASKGIELRTAQQYIDEAFLRKLIHAIDNEDERERDQVKFLIHKLYGAFVDYRRFIRTEIKNIFQEFIEVTHHNAGIQDLLCIVVSFASGFVAPLKLEYAQYCEEALLPLFKSRLFSTYSESLKNCILTFAKLETYTGDLEKLITVKTIKTIVNAFSFSDSSKKLLLLENLEKFLTFFASKTTLYTPTMQKVAKKLGECICSTHYKVAERALYLFNYEPILQYAINVRRELFPPIVSALCKNATHWNESIRSYSEKILEVFREIDSTLCKELESRFSNKNKN